MTEKTRTIPTWLPPTLPASERSTIPLRIFQTYKTADVPEDMWNAAMSWASLNRDFDYRFFDDAACGRLIETHFGGEVVDAYHALPCGAFRADLWRYCALYVHGGVYADIDTVCTRPLRRLIRADDEFVVPKGEGPSTLYNAFICAAPKHRFLRKTIARVVQLIRRHAADLANSWVLYHVAGPPALSAAVNLGLRRDAAAAHRVGRHCSGGVRFRILRKIGRLGPYRDVFFRSRVLDGVRTVCLCHYPQYRSDLRQLGSGHWDEVFVNAALVERAAAVR